MPAKKTSKTQKSSLISKLKLNTFKGRMIATVLAFALVGGGVMVYKSFAATSSGVYFDYRINSSFFETRNGAYVLTGDGNKNPTNYISLAKSGAWIYSSEYENEPPVNQDYLLCINYTAPSGASSISFSNYTKTFTLPQTSTYSRSCVTGVKVDTTVNWGWNMQNLTDNTVNINKITLEKTGTPTGTQAPTK